MFVLDDYKELCTKGPGFGPGLEAVFTGKSTAHWWLTTDGILMAFRMVTFCHRIFILFVYFLHSLQERTWRYS